MSLFGSLFLRHSLAHPRLGGPGGVQARVRVVGQLFRLSQREFALPFASPR